MALRRVNQYLRVIRSLETSCDDVIRSVDKLPDDGLLFDHARVFVDGGGGPERHAFGERSEIVRAIDLLHQAFLAELLGKRDEIHGAVFLGERQHSVENDAVLLREKVVFADHLHSSVERAVIQQDGAEHSAFGFQTVRHAANAFGGGRHV